MVLRPVHGREHERVLDRHAGRHREPDAVVHVAELTDRVRFAVVAAERDAVGAVPQDRGDQLEQVLARGALPDEDPHSLPALLLRLVEERALVVGLDAGREVGVERPSAEARRVAVDPARRARGGDLGAELGVTRDDRGEVHDLGDPDRSDVVEERLELGDADLGAGALERRRGHAARRAHAERERQAGRGFGQRGDARHAEHVGDLVRVRGDGGRAMGQDRADELVDPELGRLEVHVAVDEAGSERGATDVHHLAGVTRPPPRDDAVGDREVGLDPLARVRGKHPATGEEEVGRFVTARDREGSAGRGAAGHARMIGAAGGLSPRR